MGFLKKCIQKEKATLFLTEWLVKSSLNLVFAKESTVILELSVAIFVISSKIYCSREALNCDWLVPRFEIQKKRDLNFNRR